jgi:hypothetical protein
MSNWRVITVRTEPRGWKARPIRNVTSVPLEKKKWRYACRPFGTNSLKVGATWHVDPLLGNYVVRSSYTAAVTEQRLRKEARLRNKNWKQQQRNGVFCAVRAGML